MENLEFNKDTTRLYQLDNNNSSINTFLIRHKDADDLAALEDSSSLKNVTEKYAKQIKEYFEEKNRYMAERKVKYAGYPQFMYKRLDQYWPLPSLKQWVQDVLDGKKDSTTFVPVSSTSYMQMNFSSDDNIVFPVTLNEVNWFGDYHDHGFEPEIGYKDCFEDNSRKSVSKALITLLALSDAEIELTDEQIEQVIGLLENGSALS